MKTSSKWLIGFGSGILVLVVAAIILVMALPGTSAEDLPPADTPEGVVLRYFQAIGEEDYDQALAYLVESADDEYSPFIKVTTLRYKPDSVFDIGWKASIVETTWVEFQAHVQVSVDVFDPDGPFGSPVDTYQDTFILVKEDDMWKIQGPIGIPWYLY